MPTNNDTFKPQPHDPRWKSALANPPRKEDYPIWIDARDYAGTTDGHHIRLWEYDDIDHTAPWSRRTHWLSDKEARSPIPCDLFNPNGRCLLWDWAFNMYCTDEADGRPLEEHLPNTFSDYTHWFPCSNFSNAHQPRPPRFPEGNPPAGYRWLGEGETVREGDAVLCMGCIRLVVRLVGYKVGHFDCDYDDLPYVRPLDKPAAPPIVECRGSSDDLPPPAGLAAFEDSLDELHDKVDVCIEHDEGINERLAAVERKLDRLLSHLGAHKPEV